MPDPLRLGPKSFTLAEAHHGWELGGGVSTLLSILRNLGTDCSQEFNEIHSPTAKQQLKEYYIGVLRLAEQPA
ncbi:hypothetical protein WJX74_001034 [Apatococcus lobatus]|uniref:Cytochrome b5 heme-binding domain-containing protein n=1 Tax=Apatococcus lobatus TaxID=904363 RepID=A0AAW1QJN2_9CHLO